MSEDRVGSDVDEAITRRAIGQMSWEKVGGKQARESCSACQTGYYTLEGRLTKGLCTKGTGIGCETALGYSA